MKYYIPSARQAALNVFRRGNDSDYAALEQIERQQLDIMTAVFDAVMAGGAAQIRKKNGVQIYTRSLRFDGVQISHFWDKDGELIAMSHEDAHSVNDMIKEMPQGVYIELEA